MKQLTIIIALMGTLFLFASCDGNAGFLSASGATNEVLVLMDESEWEGTSGRALFDVLNSNVPGLPQPEANFRILHLVPENFTSTFKMARNVIIPEISDIYSYPRLASELDKYAMGQVIMTIYAQDEKSFAEFVTENKSTIIDYFVQKELERTAQWLKSEIRHPLTQGQQVFGIDIHLPRGLINVSEDENFYWATNNAPRSRRDVVIYQFPYTSTDVFERDTLIAIRNEILGKHIEGSFNSRMTTAVESYPPDYRKMEVNGLFRAELRGLWEMTTDMMGGPFVMHAFVNEDTGMVVVVETFVYAPETNKRNLMRNLEASLYTISITKKEEVKS